ncbi:MAG TPA: STAS domain-containing protein [Isosphaeraceae bacterium]|nr:STAS domain-containing protein [Isosphaeraceae bacterium]
MPISVRIDNDTAILSHIGQLMNDPRHFDAGRDVETLLDEGYRKFVIELRGASDLGDSALGLLMTMTRSVRKRGGELVLASPSRSIEKRLDEMRLDAFWEVFPSVGDAQAQLNQLHPRDDE